MQLGYRPQLLGGKVLHHRRVQIRWAVADSVAAFISGFSPLDLPVVIVDFKSRRALRPVLVAVAAPADRVQGASAAAVLVPLLILINGHQALGFTFLPTPPGELSVLLPIAGRRLTARSSPRAVLPSLLVLWIAAIAAYDAVHIQHLPHRLPRTAGSAAAVPSTSRTLSRVLAAVGIITIGDLV